MARDRDEIKVENGETMKTKLKTKKKIKSNTDNGDPVKKENKKKGSAKMAESVQKKKMVEMMQMNKMKLKSLRKKENIKKIKKENIEYEAD